MAVQFKDFLDMTTNEQPNESPDDLLTPEQAATYLARRWGRSGFTSGGLRSLRRRWNIQPVARGERITLYRRSDLDKIPEPNVGRIRKDLRKKPFPLDSNS